MIRVTIILASYLASRPLLAIMLGLSVALLKAPVAIVTLLLLLRVRAIAVTAVVGVSEQSLPGPLAAVEDGQWSYRVQPWSINTALA